MDGRDFLADLLGSVPEWQGRALCAQTDPEAFFPEKGGSTREAKRICIRCEVRSECLEYALEHDERFGIWGGLSERERRKVKRQARELAARNGGTAHPVLIPMPTPASAAADSAGAAGDEAGTPAERSDLAEMPELVRVSVRGDATPRQDARLPAAA